MSQLSGEEAPLREPFWQIDSVAQGKIILGELWRRFPETVRVLEGSLEEADPFDIVYEGNSGEYSDVVSEIVVLLAPENGALEDVSLARLDWLVREGLARCFGEEPDEARVLRAVTLIDAKVKLGRSSGVQ